nr:hypothetical protein [Niveispirillum sp.]
MLADAQGHIPFRSFDVPGIDRLVQKNVDALVTDAPPAVLGEQRVLLQETHHVGLRLEAARGITFKGFLHDRGSGFVALEHSAAATDALISVPGGSLEHPEAVHDTGAHPVAGLFAVLLALVL